MEIKPIGKITPYEYQQEIITNTISHIRTQMQNFKTRKKVDNCYIHSDVSSGKTIMMGAIANHCQNVGAKCMILTSIGELCVQNSDECWNMDTSNSLFSNYAKRKSTHFNVIVGTVGTVANALEPSQEENFSQWAPHVLMIDECHLVNFFDVQDKGDSLFSRVINHFLTINPSMVVVGLSGTPYRDNASIQGEFWHTLILPIIDREFLMNGGFTRPDKFGFTENEYSLEDVSFNDEHSMNDYSDSQLEEMHKKLDPTTTERIMRDVVAISQNRNSALITCAGFSHCQEAAACLPDNTWAIVTSTKIETQTKYKTRKEIVEAVKAGLIKYLIQVNCFTTGFNAPIIDHIVLLRPIGSLVLLSQLLGRGRRNLKQEQIDAGIVKHDNLISDFSGTMSKMAQSYESPMLEEAVRAKDNFNGEVIICPDCGHENGEHARRCSNVIDGERCEYFWQFRVCEDQLHNGLLKHSGCGVQNDIAARNCRGCDIPLIDPNAKLTHKSYTDSDWKPCLKMGVEVTGKNQDGIKISYYLDVFDENGKQEVATVNYWSINGKGKRAWQNGFVNLHVNGYQFQQKVMSMTPPQVVTMKAMLDTPSMITHRVNEKGKSITAWAKFNSGKTIKNGKRVNEND